MEYSVGGMRYVSAIAFLGVVLWVAAWWRNDIAACQADINSPACIQAVDPLVSQLPVDHHGGPALGELIDEIEGNLARVRLAPADSSCEVAPDQMAKDLAERCNADAFAAIALVHKACLYHDAISGNLEFDDFNQQVLDGLDLSDRHRYHELKRQIRRDHLRRVWLDHRCAQERALFEMVPLLPGYKNHDSEPAEEPSTRRSANPWASSSHANWRAYTSYIERAALLGDPDAQRRFYEVRYWLEITRYGCRCIVPRAMTDERRALLKKRDAVIRGLLERIAERDPAYELPQLAKLEQDRYPELSPHYPDDVSWYGDQIPATRARYRRAAALLIAAEALGYQRERDLDDEHKGLREWHGINAYLEDKDLELARREAEKIAARYQ